MQNKIERISTRMIDSVEKSVQKSKSVVKVRMDTLGSHFKDAIDNNHKRSSWINVTVLLTNFMALLAYHSMDAVLAEYQGTKRLYYASIIISLFLMLVLIWELVCCLGYEYMVKILFFHQK